MKNLLMKIAVVIYILWAFLIILALVYGLFQGSIYIDTFVLGFLLLVVLPGFPLFYLYRGRIKRSLIRALSSLKISREVLKKKQPLDPYLVSLRHRITSMRRYFKGETSVSWSPVISLAYEGALSLLQRIIIDKEEDGVKFIEKLRSEKKLHLSFLASELRQRNMITEEEFKSLEILRDLRNRVVHEDYHPTKEQAEWARNLIEEMTRKYYPEAV